MVPLFIFVGCGKTTLLNILAARCISTGGSMSKLTGEITLNGVRGRSVDIRQVSAFVPQDDLLFNCFTVYELFFLAASFYMSHDATLAQKNLVIDAFISELGLTKVRDTRIGDDVNRGVSGGERKRVSIGCQLIVNPAILFLDEPTTGFS
jgi:ABC-type multidrug transport system ATPase subunit